MTVSAEDFRYVCKIVHDDTAVALADGKQYLVDSRLTPVAEDEGLASVEDLLRELRRGAPGLRQLVIEAMVTNETRFFRDVHPFEALRQEIIPAILETNRGQLAIWSAATSTGQEAYSIALVLREHFPEVRAGAVLATDVSKKVLGRAVTGRFTQLEVNRGLPAALLVKHFERSGREWQLHADVRRMVVFRQQNLTRALRAIPPMDVIFLRYLLVYFGPEARAAVLARLASVLRPGGYLFLGGTETLFGAGAEYEQVKIGRSICYRRRRRAKENDD